MVQSIKAQWRQTGREIVFYLQRFFRSTFGFTLNTNKNICLFCQLKLKKIYFLVWNLNKKLWIPDGLCFRIHSDLNKLEIMTFLNYLIS